MSSGLELHDSRVSQIELLDGMATITFSHAYIHKSKGSPGKGRGSGWSQEAQLILLEAHGQQSPELLLPNTIFDGYLEVGGIRHTVIPLPFKRKVRAILSLIFIDGGAIEFSGTRPFIELLGTPIYLEDYP